MIPTVPADRYIEIPDTAAPAGARPHQVGPSHRRVFARRIGERHAVVTVEFYREREDGITTVTQFTRYAVVRDLADMAGTVTYTNSLSRCCWWDGVVEEQTPRRMCEEFDPAELDWDGYPTSEIPCDAVVEGNPDDSRYFMRCRVHNAAPTHPAVHANRTLAVRGWECDKGRHWLFLVDTGTEQHPFPRVVDLAGLKHDLIRSVEARAYDTDDGKCAAWRYLGAGKLQPLSIFGLCETRTESLVDDDESKPRTASTVWRVVAADLSAEYLRTTVSINLDA